MVSALLSPHPRPVFTVKLHAEQRFHSDDRKPSQLPTLPSLGAGHKHGWPCKHQESSGGFLEEGLDLARVLGNIGEAPWLSLVSSLTLCKILLLQPQTAEGLLCQTVCSELHLDRHRDWMEGVVSVML